MPEGPEVRTIVDVLHQQLVGKTLLSITVTSKSKFYPLVSNQSLVKLPLKLIDIKVKGKQIFFVLLDKQSQLIYLNSTLGMTGRWLFEPNKYSDIWFDWGNIIYSSKHTLIIKKIRTYYDDQRHFGNLKFLTEEDYQLKLNKLGPDILAENVSWDDWYFSLTKGSRQNHQICKVLMNQEAISGIGNYLKSEILYRAKIKPDRLVKDITPDELNLLRVTSIQTIRESYIAHGLTLESYWDPNGRIGTFNKLIYKEKLDPNGHKVISSKFSDGRTTYWVPEIQI